MELEWDVQQAHTGVTVRCPHSVYLAFNWTNTEVIKILLFPQRKGPIKVNIFFIAILLFQFLEHQGTGTESSETLISGAL